MNETKEKTVPARKTSPGPAGLDGIQISGCAFTESVSKREPRPPLFRGKRSHMVFLGINGGKVIVKYGDPLPGYRWRNDDSGIVGAFYPNPPAGPAYTGPITPAMWAIIRRHWNP